MGIKIRDFFTIAKNAKLSTNRVITLEYSGVENRQFLVCCEHAPLNDKITMLDVYSQRLTTLIFGYQLISSPTG